MRRCDLIPLDCCLRRPDGTPVWLADSVASPASSMRTSGPGQNPKRPSGQHVSFADRPVTTRVSVRAQLLQLRRSALLLQ